MIYQCLSIAEDTITVEQHVNTPIKQFICHLLHRNYCCATTRKTVLTVAMTRRTPGFAFSINATINGAAWTLKDTFFSYYLFLRLTVVR